jgi:lipopolysaccharide export system protein LptC
MPRMGAYWREPPFQNGAVFGTLMSAAYADPRTPGIDWTPIRRLTPARARRHSVAIKLWRWFCLGLCGLMVAAVAASALSRALGRPFIGDAPAFTESVRMVNPRFTGRAGNDGSYVITAASAKRRPNNPAIVDLDKPHYRSAVGVTVTAPVGVYNSQDHSLELSGGVTFEDQRGNRFNTEGTRMDARTNVASGMQTLQGAGPLGSVRADAYEIDANTGHVRMSGRVTGSLSGSGQ